LYCQGGFGEEEALESSVIRAINDCTAVFVAKIGGCPKASLEAAGIEPVDRYAFEYIDQSVIAYFRDYLEKIREGVVVMGRRGDAEIRQGAYIAA
ncbi:MAG: NifB/NifX family molybdenum-iron cluster-binding protein, partial [Halothiobacillus sp.]